MGIAVCFIFPESKMNDLEDCTKYALEFVLSAYVFTVSDSHESNAVTSSMYEHGIT